MYFRLCHSRVCLGCSLKASYGVNKFAVLYPPLLASLYPEHVKDYTVYGRLLNNEYMVKLNVSLFPEEGVRAVWYRVFVSYYCRLSLQLNGYTASFDLRDPGKFTFQV